MLVLHRKPCICDNFWCVKCTVLHFYFKKHAARPVELWNQINASFVQIKHCQTQINYFKHKLYPKSSLLSSNLVNSGINLDSLHYAAW